MKAKCCRSAPRCASCPVLARAAALRHQQLEGRAALVASVLAVAPPQLPASVEAALRDLDQARTAAAA